MKCETCAFWLADRVPPGTQASSVTRRYCRRYPPVVHITPPANPGEHKIANFYWPVVAQDDWCGEYREGAVVVAPTLTN